VIGLTVPVAEETEWSGISQVAWAKNTAELIPQDESQPEKWIRDNMAKEKGKHNC
jgi:hypothetical protein